MLIAAFESFLSPKTLMTFVAGLGKTFMSCAASLFAPRLMNNTMIRSLFMKNSVPHFRSTLYANVLKIHFRLPLKKL